MNKPIRVLQVFSRMDRGGAETMLMNLYRNIDREKIQFDFIVHTADKCDYDDEIKSLGGKIYHVPAFGGKNLFAYQKAWEKLFTEYPEYKIIHAHVRSTAAIFLNIAKKHGLITISHSHSTSSGKGFSAVVKGIMQYPIRYTTDYLCACSENAGIWLFGKKAVTHDNFTIIKNAIDTSLYVQNPVARERIRQEFNIQQNLVIGHVGRFIYAKNHEFLLHTFKAMQNKIPDSVLMLAGDGELRKNMEALAGHLGMRDKIIFTGVRNDIPALLLAMDVFVFPSHFEGFPVTLAEAQAAGLPCIVSTSITKEVDLCPLIHWMPLSSGSENWANAIMQVKNTPRNNDGNHAVAQAGFDIKKSAEELSRFYTRILEK